MTNIKIFFELERLEIENVQQAGKHGGKCEDEKMENWNNGKVELG